MTLIDRDKAVAPIRIERPYCDWINVACKDKRRGSLWLCNACGHMGKGKTVPSCPCVEIEVRP